MLTHRGEKVGGAGDDDGDWGGGGHGCDDALTPGVERMDPLHMASFSVVPLCLEAKVEEMNSAFLPPHDKLLGRVRLGRGRSLNDFDFALCPTLCAFLGF